MDKKKLIRLSLIVLTCIIILVIAEVIIHAVINAETERKRLAELEKERENYEATPKYEEEVFLDSVVADFMQLLNSKDIDAIYDVIDEDYKDYKFNNNKELFIEYINPYLGSDAEFSMQTYEKFSGKYLCRILSYSNEEYSSFQVLITPKGDSYSIALDNIVSIEKIHGISQEKDNILATVLYKVTANGACSYTVEYKNVGEKDINYTHENVTLKNTRGYEYKFDANKSLISLKKGETIRKEYIFSGKGINFYYNTNLNITFSDLKNNIHNIYLYLAEDSVDRM